MRKIRNFMFILNLASFIIFITDIGIGQITFIPYGTTWKYLDDGSDQSTAWCMTSFDDSKWKSGQAQLGYGDDGEVTKVSYGPDWMNKYITTYFRHKFEVKNPEQYIGFTLKIRYDDGAIVYLNGTEVMRTNMPEGIIQYNTYAIGGSGEDECFLDKKYIRDGINLLAVEIHQANPRSSDIMFDLELTTASKLPDFTRKAPYLIYTGKNTEMKICWQVTETVKSRLEWGTDTLYSSGNMETTEYGDDHQHTYTFINMIPDTKYYYRMTVNEEIYKGSFRTAPANNSTEINFMVFGDTRTYPNIQNKVAGAMVSTFSEDERFQSFVLCVGDLVGNGDSESNWDRQFFDKTYQNIQILHSNLPFQSCMGNHEGSGKLFLKYFPYPFVEQRYWSFDYGAVHIVIFDQYLEDSTGMKQQLDWLKDDLATKTKPWKFICLHEPGWSSGGHGNNKYVQTIIQPLCEQYGVQIVFAGHNHYYAHAVVNNVHHITTGGGGAPLHEPKEGYPYVICYQGVNHFCKVTINGDELNFFAVTPDGAVIDQFNINIE